MTEGAKELAQWVKTFIVTSLLVWVWVPKSKWKEGTDDTKLSPDFHSRAVAHMHALCTDAHPVIVI